MTISQRINRIGGLGLKPPVHSVDDNITERIIESMQRIDRLFGLIVERNHDGEGDIIISTQTALRKHLRVTAEIVSIVCQRTEGRPDRSQNTLLGGRKKSLHSFLEEFLDSAAETQSNLLPKFSHTRPSKLLTYVESRPAKSLITGRQNDVLMCVLDGMPNKLIAYKLGIGESTVKVHVSAILRCYRVPSRAKLISIFNK